MSLIILNIILIPIPEIGINGAAIASVVCHTISFCISFIVLNKYIKISLSLKKCIIKPIIATIIMVIFSWNIYIDLCNTSITCMLEINPQRVATIISIIMALIIYIICIILLKVLSKEELYMLPYGEKLYKILYKFRIYKQASNKAFYINYIIKTYRKNNLQEKCQKKEGIQLNSANM